MQLSIATGLCRGMHVARNRRMSDSSAEFLRPGKWQQINTKRNSRILVFIVKSGNHRYEERAADMATCLQISCAQPSWNNWEETVGLGTNITLGDAVSVCEWRALSLKGWPQIPPQTWNRLLLGKMETAAKSWCEMLRFFSGMWHFGIYAGIHTWLHLTFKCLSRVVY